MSNSFKHSLVDAFVLIHGTFAKEAPWTKEGSVLHDRLKSETSPDRILRFSWSGENTHTERLKGGEELKCFLLERNRIYPNERYNLICHSHGGNVALYACKDPRVRDTIKSLVFLGTPFLEGRKRDFSVGLSPIFMLVAAPITILTLLFSYIPLIGLLYLFPILKYPSFVTLFNVMYISFFWFLVRYRIRDWCYSPYRNYFTQKQKDISDKFSTNVSDIRCLVLYVGLDEARLWLRVLNLLSNIPYAIWKIVVRFAPGLIYASVFLASYTLIVDETHPEIRFEDYEFFDSLDYLFQGFQFASAIAAASLLIAPIVSLPVGILIRSSGVAFGYEGVFGHSLFNISPSAIPGWHDSANVIVSKVRAKSAGLNHSVFYEDKNIVELASRWCAGAEIERTTIVRRGYKLWLIVDYMLLSAGFVLPFAIAQKNFPPQHFVNVVTEFMRLVVIGVILMVFWRFAVPRMWKWISPRIRRTMP